MKLIKSLLLSGLLLGTTTPALAAPVALNTPEAREVGGVIDTMLKHIQKKDMKSLMTLFHPKAQALWSNGKVLKTTEGIQKVYENSFLSLKDFEGRWVPEHIDIEGNTAWMTGEMSWSAVIHQTRQPLNLTVKSTFILRKNQDWKIIFEHSSHRRSD